MAGRRVVVERRCRSPAPCRPSCAPRPAGTASSARRTSPPPAVPSAKRTRTTSPAGRGLAMARLIRERYELLETLGAGGEARVVKALDRQHGRFVALKIRPVRDGATRDALLNEARILLAVPPHPALPLVREDFFDGEDYIVAMDWVDGTDLARLLRDRGRPGLAPSSVLAYLSEAARGADPPALAGPAGHPRRRQAGQPDPDQGRPRQARRLRDVLGARRAAPPCRHPGLPGARAGRRRRAVAGQRRLRAGRHRVRAADRLRPGGRAAVVGGDRSGAGRAVRGRDSPGIATDPSRRPATPGELIERLRAGWAEALPTGVITFCLSDIEGSTRDVGGRPGCDGRRRSSATTSSSPTASRRTAGGCCSRWERATRPCRCSTRRRARSQRRSPRPGRWRPSRGRRISRSPSGSALHTGEAERRGADYSGRRSTSPRALRAPGRRRPGLPLVGDRRPRRQPSARRVRARRPRPASPDGLAAPERIHALKGPGRAAPRPATECPYRGLLAFEPEDRELLLRPRESRRRADRPARRRAGCWPSSAPRAAASPRCCAPA